MSPGKTIAARYLVAPIKADLKEKMVFVGGPRQVGKTTLSLGILRGDRRHPAYLDWDVPSQRGRIRQGEIPPREPLVVLDEIHKYQRWRNLMKGLFDQYHPEVKFLVTGSARLDHYRKGGDSLQGRYHYLRLHPFSLGELPGSPATSLQALLKLGGFPEPLFKGSERFWRRWNRERLSRVLYEDLRDLERVREVSLIEELVDALPARVGSPLSIRSLSEDLSVAHDTVERWVTILENLYVCFRVLPLSSTRVRAVKKERKLYFWDWSAVQDPGPRFENLVASQLLKYCHFIEDTEGHRMELRYLRDVDKREVDFVVLKDRKAAFAVEAKVGDREMSPSLPYFADRLDIPAFYQVHLGDRDFRAAPKVRLLPFAAFCREMGMP